MYFRVQGLACTLGFRVEGVGLGFRVYFRVQGLGCTSGFRV